MLRRDGCSSPWHWAWLVALLLFFGFCIAQRASPQENSGQQPSELLNSIEQRLTAIVAYSRQLEGELQTSQISLAEAMRRLDELQSELAALRLELESWQTYSGELERRVAALQSSISELETKLEALSRSYNSSEASWRLALDVAEKDLKHRSLERWLWAGAALIVGAAVGFGIAQAIP